ncbi:MAG: hypothetical protein AAGF58_16010 [Pseudomonadota bacterium]
MLADLEASAKVINQLVTDIDRHSEYVAAKCAASGDMGRPNFRPEAFPYDLI